MEELISKLLEPLQARHRLTRLPQVGNNEQDADEAKDPETEQVNDDSAVGKKNIMKLSAVGFVFL